MGYLLGRYRVGIAQRVGYVGSHYALTMLEHLQAVSLLGLIVGHYFLIRGCFSIRESIGNNGGAISGKIDRTSELLDELIQVVVDVIPEPTQSNPIAHTPNGIGDLLTMFLNNRMSMAQTDTHGDKTNQKRPIYETVIHPTQEIQTEDEHYQPSS